MFKNLFKKQGPPKTYECIYCGSKHWTIEALKLHSATCKMHPLYIVAELATNKIKVFEEAAELQKAELDTTTERVAFCEQRMFMCYFCGRQATSAGEFREHMANCSEHPAIKAVEEAAGVIRESSEILDGLRTELAEMTGYRDEYARRFKEERSKAVAARLDLNSMTTQRQDAENRAVESEKVAHPKGRELIAMRKDLRVLAGDTAQLWDRLRYLIDPESVPEYPTVTLGEDDEVFFDGVKIGMKVAPITDEQLEELEAMLKDGKHEIRIGVGHADMMFDPGGIKVKIPADTEAFEKAAEKAEARVNDKRATAPKAKPWIRTGDDGKPEEVEKNKF